MPKHSSDVIRIACASVRLVIMADVMCFLEVLLWKCCNSGRFRLVPAIDTYELSTFLCYFVCTVHFGG